MDVIFKYPRTAHIEGSGLQAGDDDLDVLSFRALEGRHLVVEEKMDGANSAVSFTPQGELRLQSRGHYLTGGPRERQFDLLKAWARRYAGELRGVLGARYVLYGEWLYAKHTIYYSDLPHYFMEFARREDPWLEPWGCNAARRQALPTTGHQTTRCAIRTLYRRACGKVRVWRWLRATTGPCTTLLAR